MIQWSNQSVGTNFFPIAFPNTPFVLVDAGPLGGGYIPGAGWINNEQFATSRESSGGSISIFVVGY